MTRKTAHKSLSFEYFPCITSDNLNSLQLQRTRHNARIILPEFTFSFVLYIPPHLNISNGDCTHYCYLRIFFYITSLKRDRTQQRGGIRHFLYVFLISLSLKLLLCNTGERTLHQYMLNTLLCYITSYIRERESCLGWTEESHLMLGERKEKMLTFVYHCLFSFFLFIYFILSFFKISFFSFFLYITTIFFQGDLKFLLFLFMFLLCFY